MQGPLREIMREAPGAGRLEGDGVCTGFADHPVCGDECEVDLRVENGVVVDYRWRAVGCPATTAVPAAATAAWRDCPVRELEARLDSRLGQLGGLARHEGHAVRTLMRAVERALTGQGDAGAPAR